MKLIDPIAVREAIIEKHGWTSIQATSEGLKVATNTLSRAFRGKPIRLVTAKTIANAIDLSVTDIAVQVEDSE